MFKTSRRATVAVAATTLALLSGAAGAGAEAVSGFGPNGGWDRIDSVTTTQQWTATTSTRTLLGDYNGDGRSDVFLYGPGSGADALWLGLPEDPEDGFNANRFQVVPFSVNGTYTPIVGDFDGNSSSDILWYGPGSNPDSIWYFTEGVRSIGSVSISGTYRPIVGNFDSADTDSDEEKDDILWWGLTTSPRLWSGQANRTFGNRSYVDGAKPNAQVYVGNFMPDEAGVEGAGYHRDLFLYTPGTGADSIWEGDGTGAFTKTAKTINSTYTPIVGDFDSRVGIHAGLTDIMWYAPGSGADTVWMNRGGTTPGSFQATAAAVNGTYNPFVIPGVLGQDSIMWNNPSGSDAMWETSGTDGNFVKTSVGWPGPDMGGRTPLVGLFDDPPVPAEDGAAVWGPDVLWLSLGNAVGQTEVFWRGHDVWVIEDDIVQV